MRRHFFSLALIVSLVLPTTALADGGKKFDLSHTSDRILLALLAFAFVVLLLAHLAAQRKDRRQDERRSDERYQDETVRQPGPGYRRRQARFTVEEREERELYQRATEAARERVALLIAMREYGEITEEEYRTRRARLLGDSDA